MKKPELYAAMHEIVGVTQTICAKYNLHHPLELSLLIYTQVGGGLRALKDFKQFPSFLPEDWEEKFKAKVDELIDKLCGEKEGEKTTGLTNPTLFIYENDQYWEIQHVNEYAELNGLTPTLLNTRRHRGKLKEPSFYIRGGYYFVKKKNEEILRGQSNEKQ